MIYLDSAATTLQKPAAVRYAVMEALEGISLAAPVRVGQVIIENVCGTGANVVATRDLASV